tara:strand:- start:199 stop:546 length:348 start_codon:yes stop_codon:yes gene_type:complete
MYRERQILSDDNSIINNIQKTPQTKIGKKANITMGWKKKKKRNEEQQEYLEAIFKTERRSSTKGRRQNQNFPRRRGRVTLASCSCSEVRESWSPFSCSIFCNKPLVFPATSCEVN